MKYILLQEKTTGEIRIIDNSTKIGKGKVEKLLCQDGFEAVGTVETNLKLIRQFH